MSIIGKLKNITSSKDVKVEVSLIAILFVLCFVMFNVIFDKTESGGFYQNVIAALIGTLITAIITTFLPPPQNLWVGGGKS